MTHYSKAKLLPAWYGCIVESISRMELLTYHACCSYFQCLKFGFWAYNYFVQLWLQKLKQDETMPLRFPHLSELRIPLYMRFYVCFGLLHLLYVYHVCMYDIET